MMALTLCLGCATTTSLHRPPTAPEIEQINAAAAVGDLEVEHDPPTNHSGPTDPVAPFGMKIALDDGRLASADLHHFTFAAPGRPPLVLPSETVRSVSVVSHPQGVAGGLIAGALAAVLGGIAFGGASGSSSSPDCEMFCGSGARMIAATFLFGVVTVPLGTVAGAAVGRRQTFTFGGVPDVPRAPGPDAWGP
jgi:hypothetical protein